RKKSPKPMRYMRTRSAPVAGRAPPGARAARRAFDGRGDGRAVADVVFFERLRVAMSDPLMEEAEVDLEVSRVVGVAVQQTQCLIGIALTLSTPPPVRPDERLLDGVADLGLARVSVEIHHRRRDDEGHAPTHREGAEVRRVGVEELLLRLHELDHHVDAQPT